MALLKVHEYQHPAGWGAAPADERSRWYCERLECGDVLFFDSIPYDLPAEDREFLLSLRQSDSRYHKNISYRPANDAIRGAAIDRPEEGERLHDLMRRYSREVIRFVSELLAPYAGRWTLDFASYRPIEEKGRELSLHKRNDLLHVDAFPSRPTWGGRILRVFTNINSTVPRVWKTTDGFEPLAQQYAGPAGLEQIATRSSSSPRAAAGALSHLKRLVGLPAPDRSPYDEFMLRFHDYLKENNNYQTGWEKVEMSFPPLSSWLVYTDTVPHAVVSGQSALEQTFIIHAEALVAPERSPLAILERMCGRPLAARNASPHMAA